MLSVSPMLAYFKNSFMRKFANAQSSQSIFEGLDKYMKSWFDAFEADYTNLFSDPAVFAYGTFEKKVETFCR